MTTPQNNLLPESSERAWWKLDPSMWMLLGGILLLSMAFASSQLLDAIFVKFLRIVDFRLWPWWYFVVLLLIIGFSIKWFFIYRAWREDDLDEVDAETAKRFVIMSAVISAEALLFVFMHATTLAKLFMAPLWLWFRFGTYSHTAAFAFLLIVIAAGITFYVVKEWLVLVLRPE